MNQQFSQPKPAWRPKFANWMGVAALLAIIGFAAIYCAAQ